MPLFNIVVVNKITGKVTAVGGGDPADITLGPDEINVGPADVPNDTDLARWDGSNGVRALNAAEQSARQAEKTTRAMRGEMSKTSRVVLEVIAEKLGMTLGQLEDEVRLKIQQ